MPELPEVETTVKGLSHYSVGEKINRVVFYRENIRYPLDKTWIKLIETQTIISIDRRAKLIIMALDKGFLLWHLGMTGSLRISAEKEEKRLHDHVECHLSDGRIIRFHDPRRFGFLKWFADEQQLLESISHYGVEPLETDFHADYLWRKSRQKKQSVKNFIMDQRVVVGVGNIYACEALFMARIKPQKACGKISKRAYGELVSAIKTILHQAIAKGGTTLKDFENAEAKPGYFQQSLLVYGRDKESCTVCETPIATVKLGGRNSFYCPQCQH